MTPTELKRIRKRLGLTQAEAAARLATSQSRWSDWEAGKSSPTLHRFRDQLEAMAREAVPPLVEWQLEVERRLDKLAAVLRDEWIKRE